MMAVESPMVTADVVEVSEFPHLAQRYQIYAVPKTVVNDAVEFEGARPESEFVRAIESVVAGSGEDDGNQKSS
jgi:predicted DsbA family dithiol-disulfide isomerase